MARIISALRKILKGQNELKRMQKNKLSILKYLLHFNWSLLMGNVFKKSRESLSDISTKAFQISKFKDI